MTTLAEQARRYRQSFPTLADALTHLQVEIHIAVVNNRRMAFRRLVSIRRYMRAGETVAPNSSEATT